MASEARKHARWRVVNKRFLELSIRRQFQNSFTYGAEKCA